MQQSSDADASAVSASSSGWGSPAPSSSATQRAPSAKTDSKAGAIGSADDANMTRLSEDANLSAWSSFAHSPTRTTQPQQQQQQQQQQRQLPSVLDAVRSHHPNLSVFHDQSPDGSTNSATSNHMNTSRDTSWSSIPHTSSLPGTPSSQAVVPQTQMESSPSIRVLPNKSIFLLKPSKSPLKADSSMASQSSEGSEADGSRQSFLIQGETTHPDHSSHTSAHTLRRFPIGLQPSPQIAPRSSQTSTPPSGPHSKTPLRNKMTQLATPSSSSLLKYPSTPASAVKGILKRPSTPATGSSVRFHKRLYDDGNESAMSNSVENSPEYQRSPLQQVAAQARDEDEGQQDATQEDEEDVEWSLSFGRPRNKLSLADEQIESLAASPHSQMSLSSLNDSPDHDQIKALQEISSSIDHDEDEDPDSSSSLEHSGDRSSSRRSREVTNSPTVRITMPQASSEQAQSTPSKAGPAPVGSGTDVARRSPFGDISESRLLDLEEVLPDMDGDLSNIVDLCMDSMPRMDASHQLSEVSRIVSARQSASPGAGTSRKAKTSTDSMPSSFSYDSMEASFTESFLREAAEGMLAGLDGDPVFEAPIERFQPKTPKPETSTVAIEEPTPLARAMPSHAPEASLDSSSTHKAGEASETEQLHHEDQPTRTALDQSGDPLPTSDPANVSSSSPSPPAPSSEADPSTSSPSFGGFVAFLPSPRTPRVSEDARTEAISASGDKSAPGEGASLASISLATTAADYATPQWEPSSNAALSNTSVDCSVTTSSSMPDSSPTRERQERRTGFPATTQLCLRPGKLSEPAPWQNSAPAADLAEIAQIVEQLDHTHSERGRHLVTRVQQAEAKFALLSEALWYESSEKQRVTSELATMQGRLNQVIEEGEESKRRAAEKDREVEQLLLKLAAQLERERSQREGRSRVAELERMLEEERHQRTVERQDWQVRLSALSKPSTDTPVVSLNEAERQRLVDETREQTRESCRRDYEVRRQMESEALESEIRRLQATVDELSAAPAKEEAGEEVERLNHRVGELEDELYELRQEAGKLEEEVAAAHDSSALAREHQRELEQREDETHRLRDELEQCTNEIQQLHEEKKERDDEVKTLRYEVSQRDSELQTLRRDLSERDDVLRDRSAKLSDAEAALSAKTQALVSLETKLADASAQTNTLRARISSLEHALSSRGLEIVKLTKANEALEAENTNFSIALSAKQLEVSMLKRTARASLVLAPTQTQATEAESPAPAPAAMKMEAKSPMQELQKAKTPARLPTRRQSKAATVAAVDENTTPAAAQRPTRRPGRLSAAIPV